VSLIERSCLRSSDLGYEGVGLGRYRVRMATDQPSTEIPEAHTPGAAAARLAEALGWDRFPELSSEQEREADERLAAAQDAAERIYRIDQEAA
jgi:hypothetical protein